MKRRGRPPYPDLLTPREQEVLALLRQGLSNEQIAQQLGVSLAGAKYHVSEILGKLGVSSREEAARWQPEARPWWLGAFAPIASLRHRLGWAPQLAIGTAVVALAAGVGLLLWGLTRTNGDSAVNALCAPGEIGNYFIDVREADEDSFSGPASSTNSLDLNQEVTVRVDASTRWNGRVQSIAAIRDAAVIQAVGPWQDDCSLLAANIFSSSDAPPTTVPAAGTVTTACPGGPTIPSSSAPLFAYTAPDKSLWVIDADGKNATQLICDGSDGATWSPSGRYISHMATDGTLRLLDVQTGNETIVDATVRGAYSPYEIHWAPQEDVLYYTRSEDINNNGHPVPTSLWKVEPESAPSKVLESRQLSQFWPSPDGSRVAYTIPSDNTPTPGNQGYANALLYVVNADGSNARRLSDGAFILSQDNAWSPDGHLLAFWKNTSGGSAMFGDVYILDLADGQEFKIGNVNNDELTSWSPNINRHVFYNWAVDTDSKSAAPLFDPAGSIIDWSPDGNKVAYVEHEPSSGTVGNARAHDLVVLDLSTGRRTSYETSTAQMWVHFPGYYGDWSPDSRYYAFDAGSPSDSSSGALYVADTTAESSRRVLDGGGNPSYSPDGAHLLIQQSDAQSSVLSIAEPDGSGITKIADRAGANGNSIRSSWQPTFP